MPGTMLAGENAACSTFSEKFIGVTIELINPDFGQRITPAFGHTLVTSKDCAVGFA